ncbi:TIGR02302 family protein [Taklimakanibacter deserti]|uniref:TIGR02302 family protein n=1 Tax=Taklimakanibacter deserti TaxID=2267839 RepID=UPI000E65AEA0
MSPKLKQTVWRARLALYWERLWAAAYPMVMVLALFAMAVLTGLLGHLPDLARYATLVAFALAFLWTLRPLFRLAFPARSEALRRVETSSALDHRPVSAAEDRPANPSPAASAIWEEHVARQLAKLKHLRAGTPRSDLKWRDPYALRLAALLGVLAAAFLYRGDPVSNFADAVRIAPSQSQVALALDAWVRPPGYTAKPPVLLTSEAIKERLQRDSDLLVPEGSLLVLRLTGAEEPRLAFFDLIGGEEIKDLKPKTGTESGTFTSQLRLDRPAEIRVYDGSSELAQWRLSVIPDEAPKVGFTADPEAEASGALALDWKASDDYGVAAVTAKMVLSDTQADGPGFATNGVFLFEAPAFPIALKKSSPREIEDRTANDLTAHPWAGLNVDVTLEAKDQAGKTGKSEVKTVMLPERLFIKPLAKALIEQRKALILDPDDHRNVELMLSALLMWPEGLIDRSGIHIALRAIRSHVANARDQEDIKTAVNDLWKLALAVEEGDLADARAELDAIRKELQKALAEGAPPERIAELMDKLREAMNKYLQSMAEETRRRMQQQGAQPQQVDPSRLLSQEDLQKMLDTIQKLAESGANEAAQEMLSQLENLLRNLQPGMAQQQQGDTPLSEMLGDLSELMRRQQQLMDETMRMPGQSGEPQEGDQRGGMPQQGQNGQQGESLSQKQGALRQMLDELMGRLGQQGMEAPQSFGQAGKSMEGATGSLREGRRDPALEQQSEALNALRDGAQSMARQMMQQGQGNTGNVGRHGQARGDDRDPLGRPRANRGEDYGPDRNMVPGEAAIRRAREILDFLRNRANTPDLPRIDRDYIERLLRGLY